MAYTPFSNPGPIPANTVSEMLTNIKNDAQVVRDILAVCGYVQGFNYSYSGGTAEFPTDMLFTRSTEVVKVTITYTTTSLGNYIPTKKKFYYSSNSGSNYDPLVDEFNKYILNFSYNSDDSLISAAWSSV